MSVEGGRTISAEPSAIKACCAAGYQSDLVALILGESYHPGGAGLTDAWPTPRAWRRPRMSWTWLPVPGRPPCYWLASSDGGGPATEPERTISRFEEIGAGARGEVAGSLTCVSVRSQPRSMTMITVSGNSQYRTRANVACDEDRCRILNATGLSVGHRTRNGYGVPQPDPQLRRRSAPDRR